MENDHIYNEIAYKKAKKRVREVKNYYYYVAGYLIVSIYLLHKNRYELIFGHKEPYTVWMLTLQGIFLIGYGIYLFVPHFKNWEEKKTKELMRKYSQK